MARIIGQATSGLAPKLVLMTPVEAVRKVAQKVGWDLKDVDLFEINEAFSVQMVAILRELGIEPAKVNVQGGAVALGHPIGASGARVLTTLIYALKRTGKKRGIASLCLGGGNGVALAIEVCLAYRTRRPGAPIEVRRSRGLAPQFGQVSGQSGLLETLGDPRPDLARRAFCIPGGAAKNLSHLLLHAPPMTFRTLL